MRYEAFTKERDDVLLSMDKKRVLAYLRKNEENIPENEIIMWASVHKCILMITTMPKEVKANSRAWLLRHGFQTGLSADRGTEWKVQKIGATLKYRWSTPIDGGLADLYTYKDTSIVVTKTEESQGKTVLVSMQPTSGDPLPEFDRNVILSCMGIDPDNPIETYEIQHDISRPTYYYKQIQDPWPA